MADNNQPALPDTTEVAAPEVGRDGIGTLVGKWFDDLGGDFGADPRRWRHDTTGIKAAQAALADPHVRAVLDQRLDAGTAAPLEIEPGGTMRRDRIAADDLTEQIAALEIDRISRELLHAVWYGYAVAECLWEIDGSRVRLADLEVRDPARFRFRADGTPLLITRNQPKGVELPPAKFTVLRQPRQHGGQPHGPGVARWCLWPVWLKRQGIRFWSTALEKFGMPALMVILRQGAQPEEIDRALRSLNAVLGGAGVAVHEGQEIKPLESTRRAGGDYKEFIAAMDSMIADAVLGQRATSEIGPWQATADIHADVLERLVAADARRLSAALQHSAATWLTRWNHPGAAIPRLARNTAPAEDLKARAERDFIIARASGLRPTQAYIEQTYGGEWEEAPATAPTPPSNTPGDDPAALAAFTGLLATHDDTITRAAQIAADGWEPLTGPIVEPVIKATGEAGSLEDIREQLPHLLTTMDTDPLTQSLHRQGFSAALAGEAGLVEETETETGDTDERA